MDAIVFFCCSTESQFQIGSLVFDGQFKSQSFSLTLEDQNMKRHTKKPETKVPLSKFEQLWKRVRE